MTSTTSPRAARYSAAATAALVATMALAAPATAARTAEKDPADATASPTDVRRVTVDHGPRQVFVKVRFTDLQEHPDGGGAGIAVHLDTDGDRRGPEHVLVSGLHHGTDYQLLRARGWRPVGEPLACTHRVVLDRDADAMKARIDRACLGDPAEVRVGVRMTDAADGGEVVRDWLGAPRTFTPWVASD